MDDVIALPTYTEERLAGLGPAALIELMRNDEDRVPRSVIDACVGHGDDMTAALQGMAEQSWTESESRRLVAAAARRHDPRVDLLRAAACCSCASCGAWTRRTTPICRTGFPATGPPSSPTNQTPSCRRCTIVRDRLLDWYIRANAVDPIVAAAERRGREALDEALAWVASSRPTRRRTWRCAVVRQHIARFPGASATGTDR